MADAAAGAASGRGAGGVAAPSERSHSGSTRRHPSVSEEHGSTSVGSRPLKRARIDGDVAVAADIVKDRVETAAATSADSLASGAGVAPPAPLLRLWVKYEYGGVDEVLVAARSDTRVAAFKEQVARSLPKLCGKCAPLLLLHVAEVNPRSMVTAIATVPLPASSTLAEAGLRTGMTVAVSDACMKQITPLLEDAGTYDDEDDDGSGGGEVDGLASASGTGSSATAALTADAASSQATGSTSSLFNLVVHHELGNGRWRGVKVLAPASMTVRELKRDISEKHPTLAYRKAASSFHLQAYGPASLLGPPLADDSTLQAAGLFQGATLVTRIRSVVVATAAARRFAEALYDTEAVPVAGSRTGARLLQLPTGIAWPQLGSGSLFVRHFYADCYEGPMQRLRPGKRVIVRGSPGIGKTAFGLYLLWQAVRQGRTVVFVSDKLPFGFTIHKTGAVEAFVRTAFIQRAYDHVDDPEAVLIFDEDGDCATPYTADPLRPGATTVLLTSPNRQRYRWFIKFSDEAAMSMSYPREDGSEPVTHLVFPVLSAGEIVDMHEACFPHLSSPEQRRRVQQRYAWWGGIPLRVFSDLPTEGEEELLEHMAATGVNWEGDYYQLKEGGKLEDGAFSTRTFYLNPPGYSLDGFTGARDSTSYYTYETRKQLGSSHLAGAGIRHLLREHMGWLMCYLGNVTRLRPQLRDELRALLEAGSDATNSWGADESAGPIADATALNSRMVSFILMFWGRGQQERLVEVAPALVATAAWGRRRHMVLAIRGRVAAAASAGAAGGAAASSE